MEIHNNTPFADGLTMGLGPERRPCLSVIVKGTFAIPQNSSAKVEPAAEQRDVATEDEYHENDVATGSLLMEADTAPYKPEADVVVVGKAHAPGGEPVRQLDVSLRVGRKVREVVRVIGDREWVFPTGMAVVPKKTDPVPFTEMPLIYERAYGGIDHKANKWFSSNPIGRGFIGDKSKETVDRKPLPNLEDPNNLISSWNDQPQPMGFGFLRKDWQPRASYAGTVEGHEDIDEQFGLPSDFEFAFYNGAHPRLQVPDYLDGNERIDLRHFTPDEYRQFSLPGIEPQVTLSRRSPEGPNGEQKTPGESSLRTEDVSVRLDTLVLLPEEDQFCLVWRGHTPIRDPDLNLERIEELQIEQEAFTQ
ncbi:MAG: DUF2169 domain-containing protein [Salinibacter sp.]|uniref:DUF2169 domain-containing protein n=1 Tax=Salinibacter sp. TaxID=2065818 RepID=UPI0035D3E896